VACICYDTEKEKHLIYEKLPLDPPNISHNVIFCYESSLTLKSSWYIQKELFLFSVVLKSEFS